MAEFWLYLFTALALVFVIEGLIYAFFPDAVRKMMAYAISIPVQSLRMTGLLMAALGFFFVWLFQSL